MNDLQKAELEILKVFLEICNKEDLQYYLVCGSALGAVKYQGFIPWDDDIDVALPRVDYEKFIVVAHDYLPQYFFLQNYKTDQEYHRIGSKLRDSRTTYIERMTEDLKINQGVFIDVFPLDGLWITKKEQKEFKKIQKEYEVKRRVNLNYNRLSRDNIFSIRTNLVYFLRCITKCFSNTWEIIEKYDHMISSYSSEKSEMYCNFANSVSESEYSPKQQYGKGIMMKFEGLDVRVPEKYDEYLTQKYGDWRKELPEKEQIGHHYYSIIDLENSYTKYMK